jgi:hypothetical protein
MLPAVETIDPAIALSREVGLNGRSPARSGETSQLSTHHAEIVIGVRRVHEGQLEHFEVALNALLIDGRPT